MSLAFLGAAEMRTVAFRNGVADGLLHGELFDRLKNDFSLTFDEARSIRRAAGISDSVINQIGRSILTELAAETSTSRVYVETAAVTLAARLVQKYSDGRAGVAQAALGHGLDQSPLRRALDYIEDNLLEDITLDSRAEVTGYSVFHFVRKFALAMGVSPSRYISQKRLENAKTELAAGKLTLVEIALNAQFSSQASFTRAFHRATGMTPTEFRRRRPSWLSKNGEPRSQTRERRRCYPEFVCRLTALRSFSGPASVGLTMSAKVTEADHNENLVRRLYLLADAAPKTPRATCRILRTADTSMTQPTGENITVPILEE